MGRASRPAAALRVSKGGPKQKLTIGADPSNHHGGRVRIRLIPSAIVNKKLTRAIGCGWARIVCGWTPGAVARIPQITSLDPGKPRGGREDDLRVIAVRRGRPALCVSASIRILKGKVETA